MSPCTIDEQEGVATIAMRAPSGNALNLELLRAIEHGLDVAEAKDVRGVVLSGAGGSFCVGLDLLRFHGAGPDEIERFVGSFSRLLRRLFALERPLVVALNGHAYAGGAVLALTGDYRIAADTPQVRVAFGEVALGLPLPRVPDLVVRQALADHVQRRLLFTGEPVDAARALALGLVDEVVPAGELDAAARRRALQMGRFPLGFLTTKLEMRRTLIAQIDLALAARDVEFLAAWFSEPTQSAIAAVHARLRARKRKY